MRVDRWVIPLAGQMAFQLVASKDAQWAVQRAVSWAAKRVDRTVPQTAVHWAAKRAG